MPVRKSSYGRRPRFNDDTAEFCREIEAFKILLVEDGSVNLPMRITPSDEPLITVHPFAETV